ncbi:MAG: DUF1648 domain-containing protein [Mangrovibacterium sp.]
MKRPKIKIELTTADKAVELIGWFMLLAIWIFTIFSYSNLPDTIPTHYNGEGKADRFGNKINILTLPSVATILFVGMTILNKFPYIFNYPTKITEENAFRQYNNATRMIRYLKIILVVLFGLIAFRTIQSTSGQSFCLGVWFLPLTTGLIFIPLAYFIIKSLRTK